MSHSDLEQTLLDEKIARIKKQNELIMKRHQQINKEIELAKKHNAMVDVTAPKVFEDEESPTLYADTIQKSPSLTSRRSSFEDLEYDRMNSNKVNYKSRNNSREDAAWRTERNEIDRERIRRQKANSGWRREWDADKYISDDETPTNQTFDDRHRSKEIRDRSTEIPQPRSSQRQPSPLKPTDSTRQIQSRGRGRPLVRDPVHSNNTLSQNRNSYGQNSNNPQTLYRRVSVSPQNLKIDSGEKVSVRKKVSWTDDTLANSPKISLKDDHLKNIKVKVKNVGTSDKKRSIEVIIEQGPLDKSNNQSKFDDKTSLSIKDCVSKAASNSSQLKQVVVKDTILLSKQKDSSVANSEPKQAPEDFTKLEKSTRDAGLYTPAAGPLSKDDDDEWEDLSDEDWESLSDEE